MCFVDAGSPDDTPVKRQPQEMPCCGSLDPDAGPPWIQGSAQRMEEVAVAILQRPDFSRVNVTDCEGATALHFAAGAGLVELCRAVLQRPDFSTLRSFGREALWVCACSSSLA